MSIVLAPRRVRMQELVLRQQQLEDAVRVYDHVVSFHVLRNHDRVEVAVLCDMYYEVHSALLSTEEDIRILRIAEDRITEIFAQEARLCVREYDI